MLEKRKINILIVEDDKKFGQFLLSSIKEEGYQAQLVHDPYSALDLASKKTFQSAVVDCLLPKMSGVELVKKLKKENENLRTLLITGVYKSESFLQETLAETKAYDLLFKPFNAQTLVLTLKHMFSDLMKKNRRFSLDLLTKEKLETQDVRNVLNHEKAFFGLEMPYLYSLIFNSKLSGCLRLIYTNKKTSSIEFKNGEVVNVDLDDKESYFGVLLVEKGFTTQSDLESGLKMKKRKPIGEGLVSINALSPHAIKIIQKEQVKIRLSKTINNENLKIEFNEEKSEDKDSDSVPSAYVLKNEFKDLLSEWLLSRVSTNWLKSFYIPWYGHVLKKTALFSKLGEVQSLPVLSSKNEVFNMLISKMEKKMSLSQIIEDHKGEEPFVLKSIYFLLLNKMIRLCEEKVGLNPDEAMKRLDKIAKDMKGKNHFELLGLSQTATEEDILKAYHHFAHFLHPDQLSEKSGRKLKILSKKIFSQIVTAYNVLRDEKMRKEYIQEIKKAEDQIKNQFNQNLEKILNLLLKEKFVEAFKDLEKLKEQKSQCSLFMVYYVWAFIKSGNYQFMISKKDLIPFLTSLFNQIPLEERHNHYYFYVNGLFHKLRGKIEEAKKCFLQALALEPNFKSASLEVRECNKKDSVNF